MRHKLLFYAALVLLFREIINIFCYQIDNFIFYFVVEITCIFLVILAQCHLTKREKILLTVFE